MKKLTLFFMILLCMWPSLFGQGVETKKQKLTIKSALVSTPRGLWNVDKSLFARKNLKYWGFFASSVLLASTMDNRLDEWVVDEKPIPKTAKNLDDLGQDTNAYLWAAAIVPGAIFRNHELLRTGRNLIIAQVGANIVGKFTWYAVGRSRPIYSENNHTFDPFDNDNMKWKPGFFKRLPSFPSMHAAGNFSIASVIAYQYGYRYALPIYAFGGAVGFSRIAREGHYLSDVVAGALLGHLTGKMTVEYFDKEDQKFGERQTAQVFPILQPNQIGVRVVWR